MWRLTSWSRFMVPYYQTHPFLNSGMMYRCSFQTPAIPAYANCLSPDPFFCNLAANVSACAGKATLSDTHHQRMVGSKLAAISESLVSWLPSFAGLLPPVPRLSHDSSSKGIFCVTPFFWLSHHARLQCMSWVSQLPWKLRWSNQWKHGVNSTKDHPKTGTKLRTWCGLQFRLVNLQLS